MRIRWGLSAVDMSFWLQLRRPVSWLLKFGPQIPRGVNSKGRGGRKGQDHRLHKSQKLDFQNRVT